MNKNITEVLRRIEIANALMEHEREEAALMTFYTRAHKKRMSLDRHLERVAKQINRQPANA